MNRHPAHYNRSPAAGPGRGKLVKRIWTLLRRSKEAQQVKIELDILRRDPVEAPFNERRRAHTLMDDNPSSG